MGQSKSSSEREVYSNTVLSREGRTDKAQNQQKEIIKIRTEINNIETKKTVEINEIKSWFFEKINKIDKPLAKLIIKKMGGTAFKSIKLEMKKETLQPIWQKYKGSRATTMSNYMLMKWTTEEFPL